VLSYAQTQLGVKEATGANDGEPYQRYMKPWGYGRVPWCALFVKTCLAAADVNTSGINAQAVSAVSKNATKAAAPAVVWWKPRVGGTGHVGLIESWPALGKYFWSIEGNTGNAVRRVKRPKSIVQKMSNWLGAEPPNPPAPHSGQSTPERVPVPSLSAPSRPEPKAPQTQVNLLNYGLRCVVLVLLILYILKEHGHR